MKKIGCFYHIRMSGGEPPVNIDHAIEVMEEQMTAYKDSGLAAAADTFIIGVSESECDQLVAQELAPPSTLVVLHDHDFQSELPTMFLMQEWARVNPEAWVCYNHAKGVTHPGDRLNSVWRRCQDRAVLWGWRQCVRELEAGKESVGCHWLTHAQYGPTINTGFWGGNAWWSTAEFLNTLPQLHRTAVNRDQFFEAECWIGTGPRLPKVRDHHPAWPSLNCA